MYTTSRFILFLVLLAAFNNAKAQLTDTTSAFSIDKQVDSTNLRLTFADINIIGYKKTKPYIIQREIPFKQGDVITASDLNATLELCRQRLMNTSLFVDVDVSVANSKGDLLFINIVIKERWYLFPLPYFKIVDRNFNQWWVESKHSFSRVNYGLKFMQNNVSGRNDNLNIWLITGYNQQASIRYENPFLDKELKHGMNLGVSFVRTHQLNYATSFNKQLPVKDENKFLTTLFHVDLAYSYRPAIKTRHNFGISYNDFSIDPSVLDSNAKFFPANKTRLRYPDISYTFQYFDVDFISYPLKGLMGDAYINNRFGKLTHSFQVGASASYTHKIFNKTYLQGQASGLIRLPASQYYYNAGMIGGSNLYMRGLEYYVIDGSAGGIARVTALHQAAGFAISNPIKTKNHSKIPFRIFVKAYTDAGYSYNREPGNSVLNNKFLHTYGFGVDVITFYDIVFKLEYSFNQLPNEYKTKGFFIHTKSDF